MDTTSTFKDLLDAAVKETGAKLKEAPAVLAGYMAERAAHLSTISHEPGFEKAVRAERNNVALRAGIEAHNTASLMDHQLLGLIQGALRVAAVALA